MPDVVSLGLSGERNWPQLPGDPAVCPVSATLLPEARAVGGMRYPSVCPVSATDSEMLPLGGRMRSPSVCPVSATVSSTQ